MAHSTGKTLYCVGFGSQARAWAECLRVSGWTVRPYLGRSHGPSYDEAVKRGFEPSLISELPLHLKQTLSPNPALIAMLCPDTEIGPIYRDFLAPLELPLTLILAHGFAVYAGELKPSRPEHEIALLAPKAIGPKIWSLFQEANAANTYHRLVAGFSASPAREPAVRALAQAMGFAPERLARATFEQETIGDLLSEQGLLCGGVFTLLVWTVEAMSRAGVPSTLIREECLTELELIAGMLRERGPASTFSVISQAAQCGTIEMRKRFQDSDLRQGFEAQFEDVLSKKFAERFKDGSWKKEARDFTSELERMQKELQPEPQGDKSK